jgi:hypothetical protein
MIKLSLNPLIRNITIIIDGIKQVGQSHLRSIEKLDSESYSNKLLLPSSAIYNIRNLERRSVYDKGVSSISNI